MHAFQWLKPICRRLSRAFPAALLFELSSLIRMVFVVKRLKGLGIYQTAGIQLHIRDVRWSIPIIDRAESISRSGEIFKTGHDVETDRRVGRWIFSNTCNDKRFVVIHYLDGNRPA